MSHYEIQYRTEVIPQGGQYVDGLGDWRRYPHCNLPSYAKDDMLEFVEGLKAVYLHVRLTKTTTIVEVIA